MHLMLELDVRDAAQKEGGYKVGREDELTPGGGTGWHLTVPRRRKMNPSYKVRHTLGFLEVGETERTREDGAVIDQG